MPSLPHWHPDLLHPSLLCLLAPEPHCQSVVSAQPASGSAVLFRWVWTLVPVRRLSVCFKHLPIVGDLPPQLYSPHLEDLSYLRFHLPASCLDRPLVVGPSRDLVWECEHLSLEVVELSRACGQVSRRRRLCWTCRRGCPYCRGVVGCASERARKWWGIEDSDVIAC